MQLVTQVSIGIPNEPSALAMLGDKLRAADVNISAITCSEGQPKTMVHMIVSDHETAKIVLHDLGSVHTKQVIELTMKNKPGAIAGIGRACAAGNINIRNIYSTSSGKESMVYIDTDEAVKGLEALKHWKNSTLS